jgi:hypothetical protein
MIECGMRNADCKMKREFLLLNPHSAFRIPHSVIRNHEDWLSFTAL